MESRLIPRVRDLLSAMEALQHEYFMVFDGVSGSPGVKEDGALQ